MTQAEEKPVEVKKEDVTTDESTEKLRTQIEVSFLVYEC